MSEPMLCVSERWEGAGPSTRAFFVVGDSVTEERFILWRWEGAGVSGRGWCVAWEDNRRVDFVSKQRSEQNRVGGVVVVGLLTDC